MASLGEQTLQSLGIPFTSHPYDYRLKGAQAAADSLSLELASVLKTLVLRDSNGEFLFLLMPGGQSVSLRSLARTLGVKNVAMASERDAQRMTGYQVGGIGPFGSRTPLPVYLDLQALDHDKVYLNGGRRGLLLGVLTQDLIEVSGAELVDVGS